MGVPRWVSKRIRTQPATESNHSAMLLTCFLPAAPAPLASKAFEGSINSARQNTQFCHFDKRCQSTLLPPVRLSPPDRSDHHEQHHYSATQHRLWWVVFPAIQLRSRPRRQHSSSSLTVCVGVCCAVCCGCGWVCYPRANVGTRHA